MLAQRSHPSQDVEAILFDLDETLIYEERLVDAAFHAVGALAAAIASIDARVFADTARVLARAFWRESPIYDRCRELGISSEEGLWASFERESLAEDFPETCHEYRSRTWTTALDECGIVNERLAERLGECFIGKRRESCATLYPNVKKTLEHLSEHYRLGVLTNGPTCLQHEKLKRSGIDQLVECTVVSAEEGIGKPQREIFEQAAAKLRTSLDRVAMVGDSQERDVDGARDAGVRITVLVDQSAQSTWDRCAGSLPKTTTIHAVDALPRLFSLTP